MAPVKKIGSKSLLLKKKNLKRKSFKKKSAIIENRRGAVFFSNLPHGFYERALDGYLRQFGDIRRIKVAKSLNNAKPLGYAYVEFEHEKVALIVAKTMNKYLMFKKLLKCQFIKHNDLNFKMWANADITPELCPGTIKKRRNQYLLASGSSEFYSIKKKARGERLKKFLKNTLGLKMVEGNRNKRTKKIRMELEDNDEEISIKTPPNVVKIKKNKDCSKDARPVLCDGDATTIKKIVKKRRSTSMEPVAKELFSINSTNNGNSNKKMKLDSNKDVTLKVEKKNEKHKSKIRQISKTVENIIKSDVDSSKPEAELSKEKSFTSGKLINNTKEVDEGTSMNKTPRKLRQTPKSLKKVIVDNVPCSTNEEIFTPKKRQRKVTTKSPASPVKNVNTANLESNKSISQRNNVNMPSQKLSKNFNSTPSLDSIEIKNFENLLKSLTPKSSKKAVLGKVSPNLYSDLIKKTPKSLKKLTSVNLLKNKTPKSSKKDSKAVLGKASPRLSSDLIKKTSNSSKKLTSVNLLKNKTPKPSQKDSKDVFVKVSSRPSPDVSKKTLNSLRKLTPAPKVSKVVLMESNDKLENKEKQSLNKSLIQRSTTQNMKNRRKSLGIKTAVDVKTPKTNRLRSKQKIYLPVSV